MRSPLSIHLPPDFRAAFVRACEIDGRAQSKVIRGLLLDFCRSQGVEVDFDEATVREGHPVGKPWPEHRRRKQKAS